MTRAPSALCAAISFFALAAQAILADGGSLGVSKGCSRIPARAVREIGVPRGYHEGLYYDGNSIWLCNGEGGNTWVIDTVSGKVLYEITPVAGFTEAITARGDGAYYTTEWDEMKVYRVRLDGKKLVPEACVSVAPAHPAGAIWTGEKLYVVTWTRGIMGTRFCVLEMDRDMSIVKSVPVWSPQEPDHLAWDGAHLWMSSWYDRKVYKIDAKTWEILGYFCSPADKTTGIAWDGTHLWLTGTYGNLFQMQIGKDPDRR